MRSNTIKSFAKINLSLGVLKKINSNFHKIETLISFIDLHDKIKIKQTRGKKHHIFFYGKFSKRIPKKNTITKLLNILDNKKLLNDKKYLIKIYKKIPQRSGLGGGSMNASTILNYLISKNKILLSEKNIMKIAKKIGSDVIFGLKKKNSMLLKNGKVLRFKKKIKLYTLIIKPNFGCSTKEIYENVNSFSKPVLSKDCSVFNALKLSKLKNDLEKVVFLKHPILSKIKKNMVNLPDILFVRMTGSGSALVGYFRSKKSLFNAAELLKSKYKNYWCILSKTI